MKPVDVIESFNAMNQPCWFKLDERLHLRIEYQKFLHKLAKVDRKLRDELQELVHRAIEEGAEIRQKKLFADKKLWPWTKHVPLVRQVGRDGEFYDVPLPVIQMLTFGPQKQKDKFVKERKARKVINDEPKIKKPRKHIQDSLF